MKTRITSHTPQPEELPVKVDGGAPAASTIEPDTAATSAAPQPELLCSTLDRVYDTLGRHIHMRHEARVALALYVVVTYATDFLSYLPYISVVSLVPGSGKTVLLELLERLVCRPLMLGEGTGATVFRAIQAFSPTLLLDEVHTYLPRFPGLTTCLLNGTRRDGVILRAERNGDGVTAYKVFGPKILAFIDMLPQALQERGITVFMQKRPVHVELSPLLDLDGGLLEALKKDLLTVGTWAAPTIGGARPALPKELGVNRTADNWRALVALADLAGAQWPTWARQAAIDLQWTQAEYPPAAMVLLRLSSAIFSRRGVKFIPSLELRGEVARLLQGDANPSLPDELSAKRLAQDLGRLGVRPQFGRKPNHKDPIHYYLRAHVEEAVERFGA